MKSPQLIRFALLGVSSLALLVGTAHVWSQPSGFLAMDPQSYLERTQSDNPQLKAFEARYDAAMKRIPRMSTLPDSLLQVNHFVESVQPRTDPPENALTPSQRIAGFAIH